MSKQAIDGKRLTIFGVDPNDVTVVTDPSHPLFDKEGNDLPVNEAMVTSILTHGVQLPAIVWRDGDTALLVDGRQRRKNTIAANERKAAKPEGTDKLPILLPVRVFSGTIEEAAELMETLNEIRRENSPMVRARRVLRMTKTGRSTAEVAALLGKSVQTIEKWLALHDCSVKVQTAVEAGELSIGDALGLAKFPRKEQDAALVAAAATKEAIAAEGANEVTVSDATGEASTPKKTRAPAGPKRTGSGAITKGTLRKVYERAASPADEEFENALTDGERLILGWALGKITTERLAKEVPGVYLLLGMTPPGAASPDEAPEVEVMEIDEEDPDVGPDLVDAMEAEEAA